MLVSISPFSDVRRLRQFFPICKDLSRSAGPRRCRQPLISTNSLWLQRIERQGECIGRQCPSLQVLWACPSDWDIYPCWAPRRSSFTHTRDIEPSVRVGTLDSGCPAPIGGKRVRSNPYGWSLFGHADR